MKELKDYREEIERCVRCGTCRSVCPTLDTVRRESHCARGRLAMIEAYLNGEELGERYLKYIKECTLCGACYTSCPNEINTPEIILSARAEYVKKKGMPAFTSFTLKSLLEPAPLTKLALKVAAKLKSLFFKSTPFESGLVSRFSLPVVGEGRLVPEPADPFFLDRAHIRRLATREDYGRMKVGFFVGCGVNYLLPSIGEHTIRVLEKAGINVAVPQGQVCCGIPALSMGDSETAKRVMIKNIEVFEQYGFDRIVTSCATCGHTLKDIFKVVLSDEQGMKERVEAFASKIRDITEFLVDELDYRGEKTDKRAGVVTYHDPCHLRRFQGISEQPRKLLEESPYEFRGMKNPCRCCGLGGGMSFTNYELSMKIAGRKAENIKKSGADVVATACPGCIVQLKDALYHHDVKARVVHVVELL